MSYSLKLANGDLSLQGGSYETASGAEKLLQDLRCAVAEPVGTDSMHLDYGSVIDGGRLPSGEVVPSPIGETDQRKAAQMVETEIRRIVQQYKVGQLARIRQDNTTYGRSTINPDEVIQSISGINTIIFLDGIYVQVKVQTYTGQTLNLNFPIGG